MMTKLTFAAGAVATVTGVVAFIATGAQSATALIPSVLGVLLLVAGAVSLSAKAHRHAIHAALVFALLGVAGTLMNVVRLGELFAGTAERPAAVIASTVTFLVLVVYLAFGVTSFVKARRLRRARADASA